MVYPRLGSLRTLALALILESAKPRRKSEIWKLHDDWGKLILYSTSSTVTTWDLWTLLSTLCQFGLPHYIEMKENIAMVQAYKVHHSFIKYHSS